jgi:UDP-N-acetylglucosamine 2-epimerase (non-hydrolysing)
MSYGQTPMTAKVMVVIGTRPEVIKLAPVVHALAEASDMTVRLVTTNQHEEMVDQMLAVFGLKPDRELRLMEPNQTLGRIGARVLQAMEETLAAERPDIVLVQGDTTSAMATALAAFYTRTPVGHVEAGLRTGDRARPFPEEMNRRLIGQIADLHFAPTERARRALLGEGVPDAAITVTGNTVVDALQTICRQAPPLPPTLAGLAAPDRPLVVVTAHRRESFGTPMERICQALEEIARRVPEARFVFPVHPNPSVRATVLARLSRVPGLHLTEPVDYPTMVALLVRSRLVITDSGGLQEEAAALGRPTLVLREQTERMEGVEAGVARQVGTDPARIVESALALLLDDEVWAAMAQPTDCYGDGAASARIVAALRAWRDGRRS